MKYYILDYGKETTFIAELVMEQLKEKVDSLNLPLHFSNNISLLKRICLIE